MNSGVALRREADGSIAGIHAEARDPIAPLLKETD